MKKGELTIITNCGHSVGQSNEPDVSDEEINAMIGSSSEDEQELTTNEESMMIEAMLPYPTKPKKSDDA